MIGQLNIFGLSKIDVAIKRLQMFEPPEGYFIAFSGGKDSIVVQTLADMAGVKYDLHYSVTSVDPPELIYFIKKYHPSTLFEKSYYSDGSGPVTMWNLIPRKKFPPTRIVRYCCEYLKESHGDGRTVVTGVRHAESANRKKGRSGLEVATKNKRRRLRLDPDNPDNEPLVRNCPTKGSHVLNPIIDWSDGEVWEFIKTFKIPYCELYDQGYKRLGCIGCPMANHAASDLERYPKFKAAYLRAFDRMLLNLNGSQQWQTADDVMSWWLRDKR